MIYAYPIRIRPDGEWMVVHIPDWDTSTQGKDLIDAIYMAKDAIGSLACYYEDIGKQIPQPSSLNDLSKEPQEILTLVDIDIDKYRREHDTRTVRKNCTIQSWINCEAEKANINFSATLQEALLKKLGY